jgi:hypothetical protein
VVLLATRRESGMRSGGWVVVVLMSTWKSDSMKQLIKLSAVSVYLILLVRIDTITA